MRRLLTFVFGFLGCFFFFSSSVWAKDYSIPSAQIVVKLNQDGSADIAETRTYQFDGVFSWADEWIPLAISCKGSSGTCGVYQVENLSLREGNHFYKGNSSSLPGSVQALISDN